jgi:SAM-dependent methyltransferase
MGGSSGASERWRRELASWAIPEPILAAAPESPWTFPVELFASRADHAADTKTPSAARALEALPEGGRVLDVGCGAGAASLPLASRASELIGVDTSRDMLAAFGERAARLGTAAISIEGRWPDVAPETPVADVTVCNHVFYNAPDLVGFARALTEHSRRRVVVELTRNHPQSSLNDLWLRFHGLRRPTRPTADDAVEVLTEVGLKPERQDWQPPQRGGFADRKDLVGWVRRRLCLSADRDPEIEEALAGRVLERDGLAGFAQQPVVTLWWNGGG